jgi:hypothetical protein
VHMLPCGSDLGIPWTQLVHFACSSPSARVCQSWKYAAVACCIDRPCLSAFLRVGVKMGVNSVASLVKLCHDWLCHHGRGLPRYPIA